MENTSITLRQQEKEEARTLVVATAIDRPNNSIQLNFPAWLVDNLQNENYIDKGFLITLKGRWTPTVSCPVGHKPICLLRAGRKHPLACYDCADEGRITKIYCNDPRCACKAGKIK